MTRTLVMQQTLGFCAWIACLVVTAAASAQTEQQEPPETMDYRPGQAIPNGYVLRQRTRRGLVISGSIVFGTGYGLSVLGALPKENDKDIDGGWLFVPVVGPLVAMATQRETCNFAGEGARCEKDSDTILVLAALFTMQAVGAGLFTWGGLDKRQVLQRQESHSITIGPTKMGHSGYGVAAMGEF